MDKDKFTIFWLKRAYNNFEKHLYDLLGEEYAKQVLQRIRERRIARWILIILVLIPSLVFIVLELAK